MQVQREDHGRGGAVYVEQDGRRVGEQTFTLRDGGKVASIDHTEVDESLRGQGVARTLTLATVEWARRTGVKLRPVCPYAKAVIEHDKSLHDVLA
jgi:predicted GNAT family acetyltransferase